MSLLKDFTTKPRHSHAVFTLWVYIPTPLFTLNQSPKDIAGSHITHC